MFGSKFLVMAVTLASFSALATPAEILIIRHGEKPSLSNADDSDQDAGQDLSPRGYQRADALPRLFTSDSRFLDFGTPVAIYAGAPKHADRGSNRPLETIAPTAKALGLTPITTFKSKDYDQMVEDVLKTKAYDGKTVLISWPHDQIEEITHAFGVKNKNIPKWKGKTFDRVWKLRLDQDGEVSSFDDLPQNVLPGDSTN